MTHVYWPRRSGMRGVGIALAPLTMRRCIPLRFHLMLVEAIGKNGSGAVRRAGSVSFFFTRGTSITIMNVRPRGWRRGGRNFGGVGRVVDPLDDVVRFAAGVPREALAVAAAASAVVRLGAGLSQVSADGERVLLPCAFRRHLPEIPGGGRQEAHP